MLIESLKIMGFGKFNREKVMNFGKGINIVLGNNETGKSTLMACIRGVLFGLKSEDRGKFEPWGEHSEYSCKLAIKKGEDGFTIQRDFNSHDVKIKRVTGDTNEVIFEGNANPQSRSDSLQEYHNHLFDILGIQNEDIFRKVAYISQQQMETDISPQVRQTISGARESDYHYILDSLREDYWEITRERTWDKEKRNDRELQLLEKEIEKAESNLGESNSYLENSAGIEFEIKKLEDDVAELKKTFESKDDTLGNLSTYLELKNREKALEDEFVRNSDEMSRVEGLEKMVKGIQEQINAGSEKYGSFLNYYIEDIIDAVNLLEKRYEITYSLSQLKEDKVEEKHGEIPRWGYIVAMLPLLIGLMLSILTLNIWVFTLAGFSISMVIFFLLHNKYRTKTATETGKFEGQVGFLHEEERRINKKLGSYNKGLIDNIMKIPTAERKTFINRLNELTRLTQELQHFKNLLANLPSTKEIKEEKNKLIIENATLQERIDKLLDESPSLKNVTPDSSSFEVEEKIKSEIKNLNTRYETTTQLLNDKKLELKAMQSQSPDGVDILEDRLQTLKEKKDFLERKKNALKLAVDLLEECISNYQEAYISILEEHIAEFFSNLTANRYSKVALNNQMVPVLSMADKEEIVIDQISSGARDQLYFAMRLGVTKLLSEEINLPFILDDPFVNFDAKRLKEAREIMDNLSEQHQILLFVHDPKWKEWYKPVEVLEN